MVVSIIKMNISKLAQLRKTELSHLSLPDLKKIKIIELFCYFYLCLIYAHHQKDPIIEEKNLHK